MGNTIRSMIQSCTVQGAGELPNFIKDRNLHHYPESALIELTHVLPKDIRKNNEKDVLIAVTAKSDFYKVLVDTMSFGKWYGKFPSYNDLIKYKNYNNKNFGEQIEKFSMSLIDFVSDDIDQQNIADYNFDIQWLFENKQKTIDFLERLDLTVEHHKLDEFLKGVFYINETFINIVKKCYNIAELCINDIDQAIDISFYETCLIHFLLAKHYGTPYNKIKLLTRIPNSTEEFNKIFKE